MFNLYSIYKKCHITKGDTQSIVFGFLLSFNVNMCI